MLIPIPQSNVLITRSGQACLGDFGIIGEFAYVRENRYKPEMVRYMAPERISSSYDGVIFYPSKESDVYALSMTCFSVCSSFALKDPSPDTRAPSRSGPHGGAAV